MTIKCRGPEKSSIRANFMVLYLFVSVCIHAVKSCNETTLGASACIRISRYIGEQWSTCVSDVYIRQKSKGRHGCARGQAICIYQCMLEVHDANFGEVAKPCTCSTIDEENTPALKTVKPPPALPSWCLSPTGTDCSWFKTCLERRFSCGTKFKREIIKFAEEMCGLYLNPYSDLSRSGSMWINGVRKCLQVALVPTLREWHKANRQSCKSLTKHAISSYSHCFYSPFPTTIPAICKLPLKDLWRIFWHLRQILAGETAQYGLLALLRQIENCTEFRKVNLDGGKVRKLVLHVKRLVTIGKSQDQRLSSEELGRKIAKYFCLDKEGIIWFAYTKLGKALSNNTKELVFYIADKHEHRMSQKIADDPIVNLNDTVLTLVEAVRQNQLCFQDFQGKQDYSISATTVCEDLECRKNTWKVEANKPVALASNSSPFAKPGFFALVHFALYIAFFIN